MTGRVRWIGLFGFIALVFGLVRHQHGLALLAMAILLWILVEWLRFVWRLRWELDRLTATRTLNVGERERERSLVGRSNRRRRGPSASWRRLDAVQNDHPRCHPRNTAGVG